MVDYQSLRVSSTQQSVFISLGRYLFCFQNIIFRGYHPPSSQCFYHQVDTSSVGGLLVLEGITHSVVSVSITRSIPLLLVDQWPSSVSSAQQSVFISLGRYLFCWWSIGPRGHHPPSSQCFYQQVDTSSVGGLLFLEGIIRPVVSVSITGSIPLLLVDYWSSRVSSTKQSVFLSLCRYLFCWWNIGPRGYHPPNSQCFYQQVDTSSAGRLSPRGYHPPSSQCFYNQVDASSVGGLLVLEGIIHPVVSVFITNSIPLQLVDYYYQSSKVSSAQQSVFLSLGRYLLCWWIISPGGYHPPISQCFYHQFDTSSFGGIVALEDIIRPAVSVFITRSIPLLLVDYYFSRVSSTQQSVFLSLGRYLFFWWTINPRGYHPPSSQCYYQQVDTSSVGGLLFLEGIVHQVVSVSITRSIPLLLVDYQSSRVSSAQQSVFLSLGRYLFCWWNIGLQGYHPLSSQCFDTDMVYQVYLLL